MYKRGKSFNLSTVKLIISQLILKTEEKMTVRF